MAKASLEHQHFSRRKLGELVQMKNCFRAALVAVALFFYFKANAWCAPSTELDKNSVNSAMPQNNARQDCVAATELVSQALHQSGEEGIVTFGKAIALCPEMDEPRFNQAVFYTRLGKYSEALKSLDRISTERPEVQLLKARILIELGREQEAEPLLQRVLVSGSTNRDASLLLSALYAKQGKLSDAVKVLLDVSSTESREPYIQVNLGRLYEKMGNLDDAVTAMQIVAQSTPLTDEVRREAAEFFVRNKDNRQAVNLLRPLTDTNSKILCTKVLITLGDYDEAERIIRTVTLGPDRDEVLAVLLVIRHQEEQALATLQSMERKSGSLSPKLAALKSFVYLSLGLSDKARETAAAAVSEDASVALAHYVLGEALIRLGSKTAGNESKQRAIALDARFAQPAPDWWGAWW